MLKTQRLHLIAFDAAYSKDLYEIWSDTDVIKYTNTKLLFTQTECDIRATRWAEHFTNKEVPNNMLVLLNGKAIGIIGFSVIDQATNNFGFFYQLNKAYWGYGYATESAKALLTYIDAHYPNATLNASCICDNVASLSILKKLGFIQTQIEKDNQTGLDLIHFQSLRN